MLRLDLYDYSDAYTVAKRKIYVKVTSNADIDQTDSNNPLDTEGNHLFGSVFPCPTSKKIGVLVHWTHFPVVLR